MQVAGPSDEPVVPQQSVKDGTSRYRFVNHQPVLPGNFAAGQYITKSLRFGKYEIQFNTKPGSENRVAAFAEPMGRVVEFYAQQYGPPACGAEFRLALNCGENCEFYLWHRQR